MTFPHLPLCYTPFNFCINKLNPLSKEENEPQIVKKDPLPLPFFFPAFLESDQVFKELYLANICNAEAEPSSEINSLSILHLPYTINEIQLSFKALYNFLTKAYQLDTEKIENEFTYESLNIPFNLFGCLQTLIKLSEQPRNLNNKARESIRLAAIPIKDIQLIGSFVLVLLKEPAFQYATQQLFGNYISSDKIERWFNLNHIVQEFNKEVKDYDLRILSEGDLDYQSYLSNQTLSYLANSIINFDSHFYKQKLKQRDIRYKNIEQSQDDFLTKEYSVLKFGPLKKRKLISLPKTQYAILALKILDDKPLDMLYVGLKNGKPTLEYTNTSTSDCWTVSIYDLFLNISKEEQILKINCNSFTFAKALIDLLCGIDTIYAPNPASWIRFLRNSKCLRQSHMELKMVQSVLNFKDSFFNEISKKNVKFDSNQKANGYYLYSLLKEEIQKSAVSSQTKQVDPYTVIPFLFRACQSLQNHSSFSDQEYAILWDFIHQEGWLKTTDSTDPEEMMCHAIQSAIIKEKIPFSVVSAWLGILAWIWTPSTSATSHCKAPTFYLKSPLLCLLPIQPVENGKVLQSYFKNHSFPISFHQIYEAMATRYPLEIASYPLIPYLQELNIDPSSLKELAKDWLTNSLPLLNRIGMLLYLELSSIIPEKISLVMIFQRLPLLLKDFSNSQHIQEILKALKQLTLQASPGYQQALQMIEQQKNFSLKVEEWISVLVQTKDPELSLLAHRLWKECENSSPRFAQCHSLIGISLFHSLCGSHPHLALSLLKTLNRLHLLSASHDSFDMTFKLVCSYKTYAAQQFTCDLDHILPLLYAVFEADNILVFKNKKEKRSVADTLAFCIEKLYETNKQAIGDYFLIEASRKGYIEIESKTQIWIKRLTNLASNSQQTFFAHSLYQIASQEKLIDFSLISKKELQQLRITLGEALLRKEHETLSIALFNQFSLKEVEGEVRPSFYHWILNLFREQVHQPIENCHFQLLEVVLLAAPFNQYSEIQIEFYQFFQHVVKSIQVKSADNSFSETLSFFHEFLLKKEMFLLMKQSSQKWQELLINYLECSYSLTSEENFPLLWQVFHRILELSNETKHLTDHLPLFKLLSVMLEFSSSFCFPPLNIIEWIKTHHVIILDHFHENECPKEAKSLLFSLKRYSIAHQPVSQYIWWICQTELQTSCFLNLLNLDSFETIQSCIPSSNYAVLSKLFVHLLISPSQTWKWIKWSLELPIPGHEMMIENCLAKISHLIDQKDIHSPYLLLTCLSDLSPNQKKRASTLWIRIATELYSLASIDECQQLFLNTKKIALFNELDIEQLRPAVPSVIQHQLSRSPSTNFGKQLILDLLTTYNCQEAILWLSFWKLLDPHEDAHLIVQTWNAVEIHYPLLKGTKLDIAHCWTLAFRRIKEVEPQNLKPYFDRLDWLDFFKDSSTLTLKVEALDSVFLNAINHLVLFPFDSNSFNSLLIKKKEILTQDLDNQGTLNQWSQRIQFALIKHLTGSSHATCLTIACSLLQPELELCIYPSILFSEYFAYFKKIVSSYIELIDKNEIDETLFSSISQIVKILDTTDKFTYSNRIFLITTFLQKSIDFHLKIARQLALKILNPDILKKIFKQKEVSSIDKCNVSYFYLQIVFDTPAINASELDRIIQKMDSSTQWLPYLLAKPEFLELTLINMAFCLFSFFNKKKLDGEEQKQFGECFEKFLDLKKKLLATSTNQSNCLEHYFKWAIHAIKIAHPNPHLLINFFKNYIEKKLLEFEHRPALILDIIQLLHGFIHLYPPQPLQVTTNIKCGSEKNIKLKIPLHQTYSENLLEKSYKKGLFKKHPYDLVSMELRVGLHFSTQTSFKELPLSLYENTIQTFLDEENIFSISRAIQVCSVLQNKLQNFHIDIDKVLPLYKKILVALNPYIVELAQHNDELDSQPLFGYFNKHTLKLLSDGIPKHLPFITALSQLYFQFALNSIESLITNPGEEVAFQAYYLTQCFQLMLRQSNCGVFEQRFSDYLSFLKRLWPLVRSVQIDYDYFSQKEKCPTYLSPGLIQDWINYLLYLPLLKKDFSLIILSEDEKKQQRALLFEALNNLLEENQKENIPRLCYTFFHILRILFDTKKKDYPYWMNAQEHDSVRLFEAIKQKLIQCNVDYYGTLDLKLMSYQFYISEIEENVDLHFQHASSLVQHLSSLLEFKTESSALSLCERVLDILLIEIPPNKIEKYSQLKEKLFLNFIENICPILTEVSILSDKDSEKAEAFLICVLKKGMQEKLLRRNDPAAVEQFIVAQRVFNEAHPIYSYFCLLQLVFNRQYECEQDVKNYSLCIQVLIDGNLWKYVSNSLDFSASEQLVKLIMFLPVSNEKKILLFIKWIHAFTQVTPTTPSEKEIYRHISQLVLDLRKNPSFGEFKLTDKIELLLKIDSVESGSGLIKKSFINLLIKNILKENLKNID